MFLAVKRVQKIIIKNIVVIFQATEGIKAKLDPLYWIALRISFTMVCGSPKMDLCIRLYGLLKLRILSPLKGRNKSVSEVLTHQQSQYQRSWHISDCKLEVPQIKGPVISEVMEYQ